ncbi:hypothetical protein [Neobacillus soli]|uniref:hypothetical protein n=1 Tax=Neobacillus soli TaxID=220688 RepID=UPI0012ED502D|nr:hypothetical protein [Neobacillus soli]
MPLITFLSVVLFLYLIVNAFRHITIYIVYSTGVGPFIVIGLIILAICALFFKGL